MFYKPVGVDDEGRLITQPLYTELNNAFPNMYKTKRKITEDLFIDSNQSLPLYLYVDIDEGVSINIAQNGELIVDSNLHSAVEVGTIIMSSGFNEDSYSIRGWLECKGQLVSKNSYRELYKVIGNIYGQIFDNEMFKLPDLRGRAPVMYDDKNIVFDTIKNIGDIDGEKEVKLTVEQLPKHRHNFFGATLPNYSAPNLVSSYPWLQYIDISYEGGDLPHNNLSPYLVLKYWIKANNF